MEVKEKKEQIELKNETVKMKIDKTGIDITKKESTENTDSETRVIPRPKYDWTKKD